ncbi:MAG: transglutaminase domain-containing protein, partial [Actinobacteria bacterium]|nr:transglutaminase domain-containing protein [Actinomycetota bacterium]
MAVQDYLRRLRYTFEIPTPPSERDVVDWFLFDLRAGYCNYYASAFAVMMRSIGVPARVSIGYFTGQWEPALQKYVVTEADAHAWPEVYFPEYGWIVFEPTPARPSPVRGDPAALV